MVISCRWDGCRSTFPSIEALALHVKHDHIWQMNPMNKADIALMRRMDLQSLHSLDSDIPSGASPSGPPQFQQTPEDRQLDTFTQLSSPPKSHSPQRDPTSPAFEALTSQVHFSDLAPPSRLLSPAHRPLSPSSGSSQEVVELHLTQEDDLASRPLPPSQTQIEADYADAELRWPSDDELDVLASEGTRDLEPPAGARGQHLQCGSLNIPLGAINGSPISSQAHTPSQPFTLQTQAPYSSQSTN